MKLIISQYLASLRERDELDAILPDLLSELGLTIFSRPGRGTTQDGVDVAAVGSLNKDDEKVYLLSIKSGDLTRSSWDGDSHQALRPSLNEIIDSFIPNRLPLEHSDKKVVICLCFGGSINEQVRPKVEGYIKSNTKNNIEFAEWNGDVLANMILNGFLKEELLPSQNRSYLRKSLALIDEPEYSYKHYAELIFQICNQEVKQPKDKLAQLRLLNICLWVLFAWCRDTDNLEPAYQASELTLLNAWEIAKHSSTSTTKLEKDMMSTFSSILFTYHTITDEYLEKCVVPFVELKHALSNAVNPLSKFDVNLKLFDILGRLALKGIWLSNQLRNEFEIQESANEKLIDDLNRNSAAIKSLLNNNPILASPYEDDQAIDIAIAIYSLLLDDGNISFAQSWLKDLIEKSRFSYEAGGIFPIASHGYAKLLTLDEKLILEEKEELTQGSVLYPFISIIAALYSFEDIYQEIQSFHSKSLGHCNMQYWFPNSYSESNFYNNGQNHGSTLSRVQIDEEPDKLLSQIFNECLATNFFQSLSASTNNLQPLIAVACRHYRYPIPMHFWLDDYERFKEDHVKESV